MDGAIEINSLTTLTSFTSSSVSSSVLGSSLYSDPLPLSGIDSTLTLGDSSMVLLTSS